MSKTLRLKIDQLMFCPGFDLKWQHAVSSVEFKSDVRVSVIWQKLNDSSVDLAWPSEKPFPYTNPMDCRALFLQSIDSHWSKSSFEKLLDNLDVVPSCWRFGRCGPTTSKTRFITRINFINNTARNEAIDKINNYR